MLELIITCDNEVFKVTLDTVAHVCIGQDENLGNSTLGDSFPEGLKPLFDSETLHFNEVPIDFLCF